MNGHKEINRSNLSLETALQKLQDPCVRRQTELLRMRNTHPAFREGSVIRVKTKDHQLEITWEYGADKAALTADLKEMTYEIRLS